MNEDTFRKRRLEPTGEQLGKERAIKNAGDEFLKVIQDVTPDGREKSLAITKLEEAVMWATKGSTVA